MVIVIQDHQLAGVIVFVLASIGVFGHYTVVVFIRHLPSMKNPFGMLVMNQSIAESIVATIFAIYFAPMVFLDSSFLKQYSISRRMGDIQLASYDCNIYTHLFIALNRFTAIYFPNRYNEIFSRQHTFIFIGFSWFAAASTMGIYMIADCSFFYHEQFWHYEFNAKDICETISWWSNFVKFVSFVCVIAIFDLLTVAKVRSLNSKTCVDGGMSKKRRNAEINFLKQACLQGVVFGCELFLYFIVAPNVENNWAQFFLSTCAWSTVHALDGIIVLVFNRDFRRLVSNGFTVKSSTHATGMLSTTRLPPISNISERSKVHSGKHF